MSSVLVLCKLYLLTLSVFVCVHRLISRYMLMQVLVETYTGRKAYNPSAECRRLVSCYPIDQLSDSISIFV